MTISDQVTFGGGGLDRADYLRKEPDLIERLGSDPRATSIALWRGRVLFDGINDVNVARLPLSAEPVVHGGSDRLFLGLVDDAPVFATDISTWQPDHVPERSDQLFDTATISYPGMAADYRFGDLREVMAGLTAMDAELAASAKALFAWHARHQYCSNCGARSHSDSAGWQRFCSACDSVHFPRTDPVVIMLITHGNSVLLGRSPGWPDKMYSLLAGYVEPGETLENAVRREVAEEAGVSVGRVGYLASQPWPYPASLMVGCHGEAMGRELTIDPAEIEDALWLTREELLAAISGIRSDILPARAGSIAHFLLKNWLADRWE